MSTVKDLFIQYIHDNVAIHDNYLAIVLIRQVKISRVFAAVVGFYVREADILLHQDWFPLDEVDH